MKLIKKYIKLLVLILSCFLVYFIYNSTTNEKNITYISLGDGYAKGLNCYNQKDYGYSDYLTNYLEKNNRLHYYYDDFTYEDIKIMDLYKDILIDEKTNNKNNLKQALRESNLLTISIGLNDLLYKKSLNTSSDERIIKEINIDFDKLIKEIKKYYKYDIYFVEYYNFYPQKSVDKRMLDALNEMIENYCKNNDIEYISIDNNLNKYYENPSSKYPNTLGYKEIFSNILSEITIK